MGRNREQSWKTALGNRRGSHAKPSGDVGPPPVIAWPTQGIFPGEALRTLCRVLREFKATARVIAGPVPFLQDRRGDFGKSPEHSRVCVKVSWGLLGDIVQRPKDMLAISSEQSWAILLGRSCKVYAGCRTIPGDCLGRVEENSQEKR